jgi:signal transduction histidine kinase
MPAWLSEISERSGTFMPHGHCYLWIPSLLWMHVLSDALIGIAYLGISLILYLLVRSIRLPFSPVFIAFGLFIGLCGVTHFMKIWTVWHPDYLLDGLLKVATAAASVATAIGLLYVRPQVTQVVATARLSEQRRMQLEAAHTELEALYSKVKELDELKTQFFANVSHELRTPLALIVGPAETMRYDANLTPQQRRGLDSIKRNGDSLLRQVNDLLDITRLEAGKLELRREPMDLQPWVGRIAGQFELAAEQRGVRLQLSATEPVKAEVDPDMMERVLINLLSNAIKFTPEGGAIELALALEGDDVLLSVSDSGPGIREDDAEIIFERFRQVDGSITRKHGGSGLGLAIVRDVVALHGGSVRAGRSAAGGAAFVVTLPRAAGTQAASDMAPQPAGPVTQLALESTLRELSLAEPATPVRPAAPGRPSVLVVEDNPDLRAFIADLLGDSYNVSVAADGQEGLERAHALQPDLIVTDIMMPRLSGDQMIRALRESGSMADLPVLLLTARADEEMRIGLLVNGGQDYLTKPFQPRELQARVANLVRAKRTADRLRTALAGASGDLETLASELVSKHEALRTALEAPDVAREQAERASEVKSLFLGMVSHELRTPIATMDMNVQMLLRSRETGLPEYQWRRVDRLGRATRQIASLVESLLEYARVESGKIHVHLEELDALAIVREVVAAHTEHAAEGVALTLDAPAEPLPVLFSDARLVRVVLSNLVSNALKFTTRGSVSVTLSAQAASHVFEMHDTGPGLEDADIMRIFMPFEQLAPVRRKSIPGVGLGLALVDQIVSALGGMIEIASKPGEGSVFTVRLPAMPTGTPGQPS